MKNYSLLFTFLIAVLSFVSCTREPSDSVDQDKIYVKYDLIYDSNNDETTVRAEFRFGGAFGTKLELSSPAYVKFNGSYIPYNSTLAYYEEKIPGQISNGTFIYGDVDGNVYSNTTSNMRSAEFPDSQIVINNGMDYVMNFDGVPISGNDVVTMNLSDKVFATSINGATSLTIGGSQTSSLNPGPYIGYMSRTMTRSLTQSTSEGGTIWITYKALNKAITIQ
jgi:hypothetical protein